MTAHTTEPGPMARILDRWSKVTSGPWHYSHDDAPEYILKPDKPESTWDGTVVAMLPKDDYGLVEWHNGEAIAAAPADIAALINPLDQIREVFIRPNGGTPADVLLGEIEEILENFDPAWFTGKAT